MYAYICHNGVLLTSPLGNRLRQVRVLLEAMQEGAQQPLVIRMGNLNPRHFANCRVHLGPGLQKPKSDFTESEGVEHPHKQFSQSNFPLETGDTGTENREAICETDFCNMSASYCTLGRACQGRKD